MGTAALGRGAAGSSGCGGNGCCWGRLRWYGLEEDLGAALLGEALVQMVEEVGGAACCIACTGCILCTCPCAFTALCGAASLLSVPSLKLLLPPGRMMASLPCSERRCLRCTRRGPHVLAAWMLSPGRGRRAMCQYSEL